MLKFPPKREASNENRPLIRLKDGEKVKGVFRGEIEEFWSHFTGQAPVRCAGRQSCDLCAQGNKASFRFAINFVTPGEEGGLTARVLEQGRTVLDTLREMQEEDGIDLSQTIVTIERRGSKMNDTVYKIKPSKEPRDQWNAQLASRVASVPLVPLTESEESEPEPSRQPVEEVSEDDIPF